MTGGACRAISFIQEFFNDNAWGECRNCHYHYIENGIECEVLDGREDWHECPALTDYLQRNEVPVPRKLRRKSWQ